MLPLAQIIIADDDRDDQQLFREAIESTFSGRFSVDAVFDGVQLLRRLQDPSLVKPAFIVLDLNMPLKDGITVLKEMKASGIQITAPVFVLSTSCSPDDVSTCLSLGCSQYYRKPFHLKQYQQIIEDMIGRSVEIVKPA